MPYWQEKHASKDEQLNLKPDKARGRGRGRGAGRGCGRGRGKSNAESGASKTSTAKKPAAKTSKAAEHGGDVEKDDDGWWDEAWYEHYGYPEEEWGRDDWGSEAKAWDAAAWWEGKSDLQNLKDSNEDDKKDGKKRKPPKTASTETDTKKTKTQAKAKAKAAASSKQPKVNSGDDDKDKGKKAKAMKRPAAASKPESRSSKKPKVGEAVRDEVTRYTKRILKFCLKFEDQKDSELTKEIRESMKAQVTPQADFQDSRYNIYWKVCGVGLHSTTDEKDHGYMRVRNANAGTTVYRMAASLKAAEQLVSCMQIICV